MTEKITYETIIARIQMELGIKNAAEYLTVASLTKAGASRPAYVDGYSGEQADAIVAWLAGNGELANNTKPTQRNGHAEAVERLTENSRLTAWERLSAHPFFNECYTSDETLIDAMIARLDKVHKNLTAEYIVPADPADATICESCE